MTRTQRLFIRDVSDLQVKGIKKGKRRLASPGITCLVSYGFLCVLSEIFCRKSHWKYTEEYDANEISYLDGGFKYSLFSPLPEEMIQFDYYFSDGLKPEHRYP